MDDFNFNFENDILYRNEINADKEQANQFHVTKIPVLTREVFLQCHKMWIDADKEADDGR